jgi:hypothetical protein
LKRFQSAGLYKNIKIFLNWFLGPALFCWLSWSVYSQVMAQPDFDRHVQGIAAALTGPSSWKIFFTFSLMIVNWGLETLKWQLSIRHLCRLSFVRAFMAILAGVALSMGTPNRIGEYGGRILYVPEGMRIRSVSLTIVGSFAQLLVTMVAGVIALFVLEDDLSGPHQIGLVGVWLPLFRMMAGVATLLGLVLYFRIGWLVRFIDRLPAIGRFRRHISVLEEMDTGILSKIFGVSVLRYLVFVLQYILMLQALDAGPAWWTGFWAVSAFFLLMAVMPSIALLELGLRWQYSLLIFGIYSSNLLGIYTAATGIWLINLVIPAIFGSLLLFRIRVFRKI